MWRGRERHALKATLQHQPPELCYRAVLQAVTYDTWSTRIQRYQPSYLEMLLAQGTLTFLHLQKKRIASFVYQLVPAFSLTYFLPIAHTCLISASSLWAVWGSASHYWRTSLLSAGSLSIIFLMGRLDCCQTSLLRNRFYLVLKLISQLHQPFKADRMNGLLSGH